MSQHITVIEYSPLWKNRYKEESLLIRNILADNCIAIYHIGSTSVEGLAAKPIIDIMAVVRSLERVDIDAEKFSDIGYEYLGEFGIEGRRYLRKGGDERTHQIHIFQADDWNNIGRHLAFRDYMRTHEKEREEYAKIKTELAKKFPYDIDGYCDGKENFVREIEKLAFSQFDGTWDKMYIAARKVQQERVISPLIEAGSVSATIFTEKENIYVGVCIDTACSLGMCAERNAIANMITNGENYIRRVIAIDRNGNAIPPCGACREFMTQLMPENYHSIEIMLDYENKKIVTLGDITSNWWI
ncbi:GrpB family protein [uncultured Subdoligranulum sp.]|jgi:GrpB-like predicted nucleotidyltransferase (UPF0157 family)/cytidine deaminase|uniref:GrpB family protein n=1 Tax=uncultured Subdoligranulum sp. TaxID=512298 RepID=UPI00280AE687|nr:GrpB family protein [uncultured Subdoligranulum sp.]